MKLFLLISIAILNIYSCGKGLAKTEPTKFPTTEQPIDTTVRPVAQHHHGFELPYMIGKPDQRFELPERLKEISGLSAPQDSLICANQDEEGVLFYINKNTGEVVKEIPFYKNGDYESVEIIGEKVYVAKSTGTIYEIKDLDNTPPFVQKHKFFLSKANDVEGLCYDATRNRLLIACKGLPATGESLEKSKFKKVVYSFDLASNSMAMDPIYTISLDAIQEYLKHCTTSPYHEKLCGYFAPNAEAMIFSPSAIAIHPITGNIYMTSSVKKILMIFNEAGKILHLEKLDKKIHPQPEGMTFDKDGTLYIANEGKSGKGSISRFSYQTKASN